MTLKESLSNWDGKSADYLKEIYSRHCVQDNFVPNLLSLLRDQKFEIGSSWLIKNHLEKNNSFDKNKVSAVYENLASLCFWEAKLHILQSIPSLPIHVSDKELVEIFLRKCLGDKNKFVRAWAYGGFYLLADKFSEYRDEAKQFIDNANQNESASVKARIRNVTKTGFLSE